MNHERRITLVWATLVAGIVALVVGWFIDQQTSSGLKDQQATLEDNQVESCVRGGIARTEKFTYAVKEEAFAVYMVGQEPDSEIAQGWKDKAEYEADRQTAIQDEAERIGNRYPGTVMNDCELVVGG